MKINKEASKLFGVTVMTRGKKREQFKDEKKNLKKAPREGAASEADIKPDFMRDEQ